MFFFQFLLPVIGSNISQQLDENMDEFWIIDDMFKFENIGFSKPVKQIKYLICADCEIGPLGWHNIHENNLFYLACKRVAEE